MSEPLPVILERADALLDEDTKRAHPALPFEDIRTQFPDQWVAMHVVTIGHPRGGWVGRIFAHGRNSNIVEKEAAKIEKKNPAVRYSLYFTDERYFPPPSMGICRAPYLPALTVVRGQWIMQTRYFRKNSSFGAHLARTCSA